MNVVDNLVCLLETDTDKGLSALAKRSIYSKDFLYGLFSQQEAEGDFDAFYFVMITLENDW